MAIRPKSDEATEAALKAVEEDLDFALDEEIASAGKESDAGGDDIAISFEELERQLASAAQELRDDESVGRTPASATPQESANTAFIPASLTPANDEKRSAVADLVYGLQRKPARWPLLIAAVFSVLWIALVLYYVSRNDPAVLESGRSLFARISDPATLLWLGAALVPSLLFFGFAILMRRAQEMRFAAHSMTEAAIRLMQPEDIATDSVATVGRAIRREVAAMGDGVERVLARASELEQMVQNEVLNLQRTYSDSEIRLRTLLVDLTKERENVVGHAERLRSSIAGSHTGLTEELDAASGRIQGAIDEATRQLSETLVAREQGITISLSQAGEQLVSLLSSSGTDLTSRIETGARTLEQKLASSAENLSSSIDMAGNAVASLLETRTVSLQEQGDILTRQFEDAISIRAAEFTSRISETGEALQGLLDHRLERMDETLSTKGEAFVQSLGARTEALDKVLSERSQAISDTLKERLSLFGQHITGHLEQVKTDLDTRQQAVEAATNLIGETIVERSGALENALLTRNREIQSTYQEGESAIRQAMEAGLGAVTDKAAAIRESLQAENAAMTANMDDRSRALLAGLDERIQALSAGVEENASMLRGLMEEKSKALFEGFAATTGELVGGLDRRTASMLEGIDSRSQGFASGLEERVSGTIANVDSKTTALLTGLDSLRENIDSGMQKRSGEIERAMEAKATELGTILAAGQQTIETAIEGKYGIFSKMLEERNQAISADFDARIEKTVGMIDEKAAAISDILTERAAIIQTTLGGGLTESQRLLETKTREFNELLSTRSRELASIIEEQALPVAETIRVQGEETASKLAGVNRTLNADASELLTKLGSISEAMDALIRNAAADLGSMKDTITTQAASMSEAVEKARTDVDRSSDLATEAHLKMDETASNLLANIGSIAERFEQQGRMLQQATQIIDAAQRDFSATLEDREGALSGLASGLSQRTVEIERSMAAFGEMLTRTMDEMTQRSRLVGTTVSTEIGTAIEETTARFAAATDAMRQASTDIQRELEATRAQMRRGVIELPEETRQSADAMRKVVADQIAALRDLSEIVTKSGKALDSSPSRSTPPSSFASTVAPSRPVAAPRPQSVSAPSFPPRTSAATAEDLQQRERGYHEEYPPAMMPHTTAAPRHEEPASRPQAPVFGAPASPAPRSSREEPAGGPGWVSDLLKRASREEADTAARPAPQTTRPPSSQLHRIESLNSISMDIARLIDHEASIDLWDRYQRGERNVFTRRLYTLQGQQTFEEIRDKYSREPEFRRAVDRYVEDFERLLADVAGHDRDNIMTQTYLTSDTGKVYTMLAHASGRFGKV